MTINNLVGPWLSEISFAAWGAAILSLIFIFTRFKSVEAIIVGVYLTAILSLGNTPSMWLEPFHLMLAHTILATGLLLMHVLLGVLKNGYGNWMITLAGVLGFADAIFYVTGITMHYHAWALFLIFLAMCFMTIYACRNAHKNNGVLGKYVYYGQHTEGVKAVQR